jgi:hypothetical protein
MEIESGASQKKSSVVQIELNPRFGRARVLADCDAVEILVR